LSQKGKREHFSALTIKQKIKVVEKVRWEMSKEKYWNGEWGWFRRIIVNSRWNFNVNICVILFYSNKMIHLLFYPLKFNLHEISIKKLVLSVRKNKMLSIID
jgi:hypothetical protein